MHILIIPSEEYIPTDNPLCGIFQSHQAEILRTAGNKIGVISVNLAFSIPMIIKSLAYKLIKKRTRNITDSMSFTQVFRLFINKLFSAHLFLKYEEINDIKVYRSEGFYYLKNKENFNHFGWIKAGLVAFSEYVKKEGKPDIVHAHNAIYAGMLARKIKYKYNIPYILTEHSTFYERGLITNSGLLKRINKAYVNANHLLAVSNTFCNALNKKFKSVIFRPLSNVLDPYLEDSVRELKNSVNGKFIFLNIGELHPKKDQESLIKAFQVIHKQNPNSLLYIGGDGMLHSHLKKLVYDLQLNEFVIFLGPLNREEVVNYMQKSNCLVLSSKYETFGVVIIEAMLFGKPIIATRCGGPEDIVIEKVGELIPSNNIQQLIQAMNKMIHNYGNYNSQEISDIAISNYGQIAFTKKIVSIYKQVISHDK